MELVLLGILYFLFGFAMAIEETDEEEKGG